MNLPNKSKYDPKIVEPTNKKNFGYLLEHGRPIGPGTDEVGMDGSLLLSETRDKDNKQNYPLRRLK